MASAASRDDAGPYRAFEPPRSFDDEAHDSQAPRPPAPPAFVPAVPEVLVPLERAERIRLLMGALVALYFSVWTLGWTGGAWPAHILVLDLALGAVVVLFAWRARMRVALVPLAGGAMHLVAETHLIPAPRSLVEWGATAVALGFALLLASLAATYRLRRTS